MGVDVDQIRSVETPTRIVHGPGAITRLGQIVAEHGIWRPLLVTAAGVRELDRLTAAIGIPTPAELGFSEDEIPLLARIAFKNPQTIGVPRVLGVAEYEAIYRDAFSRG